MNSCVPLSLRLDSTISDHHMRLCGYVFECLVVEFERECQNQCPVTCVNHVYNLDVIAALTLSIEPKPSHYNTLSRYAS